jgi:hypothetical protein
MVYFSRKDGASRAQRTCSFAEATPVLARFQRAMMRLSESHDACINGQTDGAASAIKLAWMAES